MKTMILAFALLWASPIYAQVTAGDLDSTFGTSGKVTTDFSAGTDEIHAVAVQADGKIVVAGETTSGGNTNFALARYNSDGTLDSGFGTGGKATTDFGGSDVAQVILIQPDGKIVAAGYTASGGSSDFALARYLANGQPDNAFGTTANGRVVTDFGGGQDAADGIAIQADLNIVVAGSTSSHGYDFALARYQPDGKLDNNFGGTGRVTTDFGTNSEDGAKAVAIQADGKAVAAGTSNFDFALSRYQAANGALDLSFDLDGKLTTTFGSSPLFQEVANAVVIQTDGKIIAAGSAAPTTSGDFALVRYLASGAIDTAFGSGGRVTTDFGGNLDAVNGLVLTSDGHMIAAGISGGDFALARYGADGTLDGSFGAGGKVTTDFAGGVDYARGLALQGDGKVVVAGFTGTGGNKDFALARYVMVSQVSGGGGGTGATGATGVTGTTGVSGGTDTSADSGAGGTMGATQTRSAAGSTGNGGTDTSRATPGCSLDPRGLRSGH